MTGCHSFFRAAVLSVVGFFSLIAAPAEARASLDRIPRFLSEKSGFFEPERSPSLPLRADRAIAANPAIDAGIGCSGVVVSDQGHLLTALHCLLFSGVDLLRPERFPAGGVSIRLKVNGAQTDGRVLALGAGMAALRDGFMNQDFWKNLPSVGPISSIESIAQDFALIQVDSLAGGPCVPMQTGSIDPGNRVWVFGYPSLPWLRGRDKNAHLVSAGELLAQKASGGSNANERAAFYVSDASVFFGESGGPAISQDGRWIGTLSSGVIDPLSGRMRSYFVSNETVLERLRQELGDEGVLRALSCSNGGLL